jgi:MOSC domain-containing protein YiiM
MATVEYIHIAPEASKPMIMLPEAEVIAGRGIKDDRYANEVGYYSAGPKAGRQVTLIEAEVIEAVARECRVPFTPHDSRRNVTTRGSRLNPLVGYKLRIGTVILEVIRLCDPCKYLEGLVGQPVLQALVDRGGIRCDVLTGGVIRVGETINVLD